MRLGVREPLERRIGKFWFLLHGGGARVSATLLQGSAAGANLEEPWLDMAGWYMISWDLGPD